MSTISQLQIEQQRAVIEIKTTNAAVQISTPRPQMRIIGGNQPPQMQMEMQDPEFEVDWQRVRSESGLTPVIAKTKEIAGETQQLMLEYTSEAANDGSYLSQIEMGGNRVAQLAKQKTYAEGQTDINLGLMPQSQPNIQWTPGNISINWENSQLEVEWDGEFLPSVTVEPHSVEIFLRDRPYIKITVVESAILSSVGRQVDMEA